MIVVTGASSYVGINLIKNFSSEEKKNVICLVREQKDEVKVKQEVVDFNNPNELKRYINNGDTIVHILGITDGKSDELYNINHEITKNLVDVCVKQNISKFIFLSSAIVNGRKRGDYGNSKAYAEEYITKSGLNYIILRPTIIYGKNEKKFIGRLINYIKNSKIVLIIGNGEYKISPIIIRDVIDVIRKSIYQDMSNGNFYLAGSEERSMNEICNIIADKLNRKVFFVNTPLWLLISVSPFIRFFNKQFPSIEQLKRISLHEKYFMMENKNVFKVEFCGIMKGLEEVINNE